MEVVDCYRKRQKDAPMVEAESLFLRVGYGIVDDANADPFSPRQVLLVADAVYSRLNLAPASLRENLRVKGRDLAMLESGQLLQVGKSAILRLTIPCEPCAKLNRVRRGLAKEIADDRGKLARVIRAGSVRPGDSITILKERLPTLSNRISERVYGCIRAVPEGCVVTYSQITRAIGVSKSYARVMPRMLLSAPEQVPVHRVLSTNRMLIDRHIPGQKQMLKREGVIISERGIVDRDLVWKSSPYVLHEEQFGSQPRQRLS
jgi:methylated-DNA-protein-cysteine methyltransferase-like protein